MKKHVILFFAGLLITGFYSFAEKAPDPLLLKAQQFESENKLEEAMKIYERLYKTYKLDTYFWRLINLYERTEDYEGVEILSLSKLAEDPNHVPSKRYLARSLYLRGKVLYR